MATIGIPFAAQQSSPTLVQADFALGPEANATPAQDPAQQDVVTLAGRAAESGQTRAGADDAQFGQSAAFFFAEQQSFKAANGSVGRKTAEAASVPELPVKLTTDGPVAHNAVSSTTTDTVNPAELAANAPEQGAADNLAANLSTNNAIGPASRPSTETADTPLAELTQLDRTLQQIGINPQSISLFNRMAMLLYANDPAALKILVQTLQSGAHQLATDSNAQTPNVNQASSEALSTPAQNVPSGQMPASDAESGSGSATLTGLVVHMSFEKQKGSSSERRQPRPAPSPGGTEPNDASRAGTSKKDFQGIIKLDALSPAFAAVGARQFASELQDSQQGKLLNVTF